MNNPHITEWRTHLDATVRRRLHDKVGGDLNLGKPYCIKDKQTDGIPHCRDWYRPDATGRTARP